MKKVKKGSKLKKCKICGKEKIMTPFRVTCSSKCAHKYRNSKTK